MSSDYKTAQTDTDNNTKNDESPYKTMGDDDLTTDIYGRSMCANQTDPVSDTEDNQTIYIVTVEPNERTLFLVVSDMSIREKDSMTGR